MGRQLPSHEAGGEPPQPPHIVLSRRGHPTSSAPYFTPERGWSAPTAGATGPDGALGMLSARGAAAAAVLRAALGRGKRASGRVPARPPVTVTRTLSAYRCSCRDVLRAVELSTAHMLSTQPKAAANIKFNTETKVGIDVRAPPAMLSRGVQSGRFRAHKDTRSCHASLSAVSLLYHEPLFREPSPNEAVMPVARFYTATMVLICPYVERTFVATRAPE